MRDSCSEEKAFAEFAEYARQDLAKAGPSDAVKSKADDLGGFRKNHVSCCGNLHCLDYVYVTFYHC
jgi:hypothetical protein